MSIDAFTLSWFIIFAFIILIAFLANLIIVLAILKDKSMHTSTYFYIINVNVADILLLLTCLPERLAEVIGYTEGFHLGMLTCKILVLFIFIFLQVLINFISSISIYMYSFLSKNIFRKLLFRSKYFIRKNHKQP